VRRGGVEDDLLYRRAAALMRALLLRIRAIVNEPSGDRDHRFRASRSLIVSEVTTTVSVGRLLWRVGSSYAFVPDP
jgi:hypothetical protein